MNKIIVSTGGTAVDIDGYACAIALSELLKLLGKDYECVVGPLNHSVTSKVLNFPTQYTQKHVQVPEDSFVLVDFSEPDFIPEFITDRSKIVVVYDHHFGYETYWKEKIGDNAHIERVGACATIIWEEFEKVGLANKINNISANLLYTAIVSNTLNFKASVTNERDSIAFEKLKEHIILPANWIKTYFTDQEDAIFQNTAEVVKGDTKSVSYPNLPFSLTIGQLELWNGKVFISNYLKQIEQGLLSFNNPHYFMMVPSISEGKDYLFSKNQEVKDLLVKILGVKFINNIAQTDKLYLRKEILKKLQEI